MRIAGQLVEVEHNSGSFTDKTDGRDVQWSNASVRVFDGREVTVVKVKTDEAIAAAMGLKGREGQPIAFEVDSPRQVETRSFKVHDSK